MWWYLGAGFFFEVGAIAVPLLCSEAGASQWVSWALPLRCSSTGLRLMISGDWTLDIAAKVSAIGAGDGLAIAGQLAWKEIN